jgi:drug/metabolite transporter (DMT)-like permease
MKRTPNLRMILGVIAVFAGAALLVQSRSVPGAIGALAVVAAGVLLILTARRMSKQ